MQTVPTPRATLATALSAYTAGVALNYEREDMKKRLNISISHEPAEHCRRKGNISAYIESLIMADMMSEGGLSRLNDEINGYLRDCEFSIRKFKG